MSSIKKMSFVIYFLLVTAGGYAQYNYEGSSFCGEKEDCLSCCEPLWCGEATLSVDFLYWRAFENGLDACAPSSVSDTITPTGRVISRFKGRGRDPRFEWNPGFRLGVGYDLAATNWELDASWTHFNTHSHRFLNTSNKIHWSLNLEVVDLIASYQYDFNSCFALIPFFGLRGARIDQKLHITEFPSLTSSATTVADFTFLSTKNKEGFFGIGPLIGLEGDWNIGCGFSLYANASVTWLYGNFDVRFSEFERLTDAVSISKVRKRLDASLAGADAALGVRWDTCFYMNTRLILGLGLEHHRYFDFNRFGEYGDLSFDGINISAAIQF
jgi:Legionella pneumophila major outer membrane protein precursor